jgi:FAD:protein FMN transferase
MRSVRSNAEKFSRRRFITVVASTAAALSTYPIVTVNARALAPPPVRWRGVAMGADASLTLSHENPEVAAHALKACLDEIARLEMILSLYEPNSELSRLNRDAVLADPSIDFVRCLSEAHTISELTGGAFDPSVQPLFEFYQTHFDRRATEAPDIDNSDEFDAVRSLVNFRNINIAAKEVSFRRKGMAVTLNGIAQGYVCDRVSALLRGFGFENALVNLGEISALGHGPGGRPWLVEISNSNAIPESTLKTLKLKDRAVATSAPSGHMFDKSGRHHHMFDPHNGHPSNRFKSVTVVAPNATMADGLSTAMAVMSRQEISALQNKTTALDVYLQDLEDS